VATDDLNAPLGMEKKQARSRLPSLALPITAGVLGFVIAMFGAWAVFNSDPMGGEPMVVVHPGLPDSTKAGADKKGVVEPNSDNPNFAAKAAGDPAGPQTRGQIDGKPEDIPQDKASGSGEQIITIIDGKSGARQQVKIPANTDPAARVADTPLVEMTRNGPLPRIGADGLRAAQAYARPVSAKLNSPQIAIVVTGLGISANITTEAINKLPGPITFAFTPYGADLERIAGKARSLGHELLLQVPMEPFDYPENDPGPQTLVTSLTPEQNVERLQWAMGRFQGYVGVSNQMGARFSASELSFTPVMREIARRGLIYVEDGSSPRSLAGQIAGGNNLPFAKANLVLDTVPTASEIDRALTRLEGAARENGIAVGFASALPVSIERIFLWAKNAEGRGFTLAPITAAAARGKSS
jgi:uncharacterized protein